VRRIVLVTVLLVSGLISSPPPAVHAAGPAPVITAPASAVWGTEFVIDVSNCVGATTAKVTYTRSSAGGSFVERGPWFDVVRSVDGTGHASFTSRGNEPSQPWGLFGRPTFGPFRLSVECTYGPGNSSSSNVSIDLLPPAELPPTLASVSVTPRTIAIGRRPTSIRLGDAAATSFSVTSAIGVWLYPGGVYVGDALLDPSLPPPTVIPSPSPALPAMPAVAPGRYTMVLQQGLYFASTTVDVGTAFGSLTPARLLETRARNAPTVDGQSWGEGRRAVGQTTELVVAGRGGVPADAPTVALNMTVTEPLGDGFVTVFPCGSARPNASNINFVAGQTVANLVIAKVGIGGKVCVFNSASTHLVADVTGWLSAASGYESLVPARLLESRAGEAPTIDGQAWGAGKLHEVELTVAGRGGVPLDAAAVALSVTVTEPQDAGFVKVWPCGEPAPNASSLNYVAGQTVANAVIAKVGAGGKVCLLTSAESHLIADVNGSFADDVSYEPLQPARLVDTRPDGATIDGQQSGANGTVMGAPPILPNMPPHVAFIQTAGRGGVGPQPSAVVLNVAVTQVQTAGYLSLYPCVSGTPPPVSSNLNFAPGQTVANAVLVAVDWSGMVCVGTSGAAHVVVDVDGWFP
jgi:hypothetical protein